MLAAEMVFATLRSYFRDHVYPSVMAEDTELPAAVFQKVSGVAVNALDDGFQGVMQVRMQVDVYATTPEETSERASGVINLLTQQRHLDCLFLAGRGPELVQEARLYRESLDFSIWEITQ